MIKKIKKKMDERYEKKQWGKGTIVLNSMKEFDEIFDKFGGQMTSPGGAAGRLGVSRAYINQLEKEGRITAYRIWKEDINWEELPPMWKLFMNVKDVYIYIPDEDIEKIREEMLKKAKSTIKKLTKK